MAFALIFGVHYRTYLLTGYPLYPIALSIFNLLGFKGKNNLIRTESVNFQNPISIKGLYERIRYLLFDPTNLGHIIMCWTSNIIIIAFIIWLFNKKDKENIIRNKSFKIMVLIFSMLSIYYISTMPMPDGNYFILPFTFITLYFVITTKNIRKYVYLFIPMVLINLVLILTSHWSWYYGTHEITYNIVEDNFESYKRDRDILLSQGLHEIDEYAINNLYDKKVLASSFDMMYVTRLKCRIETAHDLGNYYTSGYALANFENFKEYIKESNTYALLLDKGDETYFNELVKQYVEEFNYKEKVENDNFILYVLADIN